MNLPQAARPGDEIHLIRGQAVRVAWFLGYRHPDCRYGVVTGHFVPWIEGQRNVHVELCDGTVEHFHEAQLEAIGSWRLWLARAVSFLRHARNQILKFAGVK